MNLLINEDRKRLARSVYDRNPPILPDLIAGETIPISVARLREILFPIDARVYQPQDVSGDSIQVALGPTGSSVPVAGRYKLTFTATDLTTETTDWLQFDSDAETISEALNRLTKVIAAGGVAVQGGNGFFEFRFNTVGTRALISGDSTELTPASIISITAVTEGDSDSREIQVMRVLSNAGASTTLSTDSSAGSIAIAVTAGTASTNTTARITISDDVYDGKWKFKKDANASALIDFDASEAQVRAAIEATTGIGTGNVDVAQESDGTWFVEFIGSLANTSVATLTVVASNLRAISLKSGTLDLRTAGVDMMLNGDDCVIARLEVQQTPSGGTPRKILSHDVLLKRAVLEPAMTQPSSVNLEAYSGVSTTITVSTTGTSDLAPPNRFFQWFQRVIASAGNYTRKLTIDNTLALEGARFTVAIELAASATNIVQIYDDSVSGTKIDEVVGDAAQARYYNFEGIFKGGHWEKVNGEFVT